MESKTHELSMMGEVFLNDIMRGKKKYEGRIYSDKCKQMRSGDILKFYENSCGWGIVCKIINLHPFSSFKNMCSTLGILTLLPQLEPLSNTLSQESLLEEAVKIYESFPGSERVKQLGCVGIEVEFLSKY